MTIEPHELFEGINIAEALETLDLPEATRDFIRDELEVMAPEAFPDDPLWTYWEHIPDEHKAALNAAAEAFEAASER